MKINFIPNTILTKNWKVLWKYYFFFLTENKTVSITGGSFWDFLCDFASYSKGLGNKDIFCNFGYFNNNWINSLLLYT